MNVVDSSGWLEYFGEGPNADFFAPAIRDLDELVVPVICIYEVFKRILQQRSEDDALDAVTVMLEGTVVELNPTLALDAAKISHETKLPMADSIILATARTFDAVLWTQDKDLRDFDNVKFVAKK